MPHTVKLSILVLFLVTALGFIINPQVTLIFLSVVGGTLAAIRLGIYLAGGD